MDGQNNNKVLTISVAGYNVADYIPQTLDSCLGACADDIEVIIVDDGATDSTGAIADDYARRYPNVFRVIHKENGGYGTTVNASLKHARGKYFKILDGDDWYSGEGLATAVAALAKSDADMLVTPFVRTGPSGEEAVDQVPDTAEGVHAFEDVVFPWRLNMHSVAYRTQLLRDCGFALPGRRLFTDILFATLPLVNVKRVQVLHEPLYWYRMGRVGQSLEQSKLMKNRGDKRLVIDDLMAHYDGLANKDSQAARLARCWLADLIVWQQILLYRQAPTHELWQEIEGLQSLIRSHPDIHREALDHSRSYIVLDKVSKTTYPLAARVYAWVMRGREIPA